MKEIIKEYIKQKLNESNSKYKLWKRKNVTLRGIKELGKDNGVYGSYGNGLYTVPLSNAKMAKEYGRLYYVLNAKPKNPKILNTLNDAEIWIQNLINSYCLKNNQKYSRTYFENNTTIEKQMLELGYDGLIIKGREVVNYKPENIIYFENDNQLERYYENTVENKLNENINNKIYYHGRNNNRPKYGNNIFITDSEEYAKYYSDGKEIYVCQLLIPEEKIFSILNENHLILLKNEIGNYEFNLILKSKNENSEIDWTSTQYINNDKYDDYEDLLTDLGFEGIKLNERPGITSIEIFDQDNVKIIDKKIINETYSKKDLLMKHMIKIIY
jgi:hypothetical protein